MMNQNLMIVFTFLGCALYSLSCVESDPPFQDSYVIDDNLCLYVENSEFNKTKVPINTYLESLHYSPDFLGDYDEQAAKMDSLRVYLDLKECTQLVEKRHMMGCIETSPLICELDIEYITKDSIADMILDIRMTVPMKAGRYH